MPSFVITQSRYKIGEPIDAILCDPGALGFPDRGSDTPVRVKFISDRTLFVDDEPRGIISSIGENGTATILADGSTKGLRNRERRAALARASSLLQQLASALRPLTAESEEPELATEGLGLLFNWLSDERDRLTEGARSHGPQ